MLTRALDQRRWLRLFEESDAEELYAVVDANRGYLGRWMPWAVDDDLEKVQDFIRMSRRQFADTTVSREKSPHPPSPRRRLNVVVVRDSRYSVQV